MQLRLTTFSAQSLTLFLLCGIMRSKDMRQDNTWSIRALIAVFKRATRSAACQHVEKMCSHDTQDSSGRLDVTPVAPGFSKIGPTDGGQGTASSNGSATHPPPSLDLSSVLHL